VVVGDRWLIVGTDRHVDPHGVIGIGTGGGVHDLDVIRVHAEALGHPYFLKIDVVAHPGIPVAVERNRACAGFPNLSDIDDLPFRPGFG